MSTKPERPWEVGDKWLTSNLNIFEVVSADNGDGLALVKLIHPFVTRPMTQKLVPDSWIYLGNESH